MAEYFEKKASLLNQSIDKLVECGENPIIPLDLSFLPLELPLKIIIKRLNLFILEYVIEEIDKHINKNDIPLSKIKVIIK